MRILQLRAARGWTLEKTARVFLVDLQTLLHWMRRVDEQGERALIQTVEPVNRYPDFVRNLVRQLKCLFPAMGYERMAQVLARAGLVLGATTIRRIVRERVGPPDDDAEMAVRRRRRVVAKYPGHVCHVDLTTVPTRAGFWVPWFPFSLPQRWPFCIAIVERFIRSMKQECTRCLLVPMSLAAMRRELSLYATRFNTERPHTALAGKTLREVCAGRAVRRRRYEPRAKWPHGPRRRKADGDKIRLAGRLASDQRTRLLSFATYAAHAEF